MKLYPGDKVMDDKGRTLRLTARENALACENCEDDEWDGAGPADEFPRT